jgi:uncharacterized membrane protein YkoI
MKNWFIVVSTGVWLTTGALATEKKVQLKDLPSAVQRAMTQQTKGAQIKGYELEVENGKTFYEAETVVNGKSRDILFDAAGALVEVEEETTLDSIPAPAKAALEKAAAGGKITKVETVTSGGRVNYEAAITKGMKRSEFAVGADGSVVKE